MTAWSRKLVLFLALAVMPLQGLAVAFTALLCHGDAQTHAMHVPDSHDHARTGHDGHHGAPQDDGSTGSTNAAYHLCCNMTVSVPSSIILAAIVPDFPVRASAPDPLHDLFIPDRPQRPPLA